MAVIEIMPIDQVLFDQFSYITFLENPRGFDRGFDGEPQGLHGIL